MAKPGGLAAPIRRHRQFWFESFQNWQSEFLASAHGGVVDLSAPARVSGIQAGSQPP